VVAAISADSAASGLVTAYVYGGTTGAGIVQPRTLVNLSDFLSAPAGYPRGQFHMQALRIGSVRDGSKVGVFIYCEQHAREWVTPNVCLETAERLVRNYAIDPTTKEVVDNLNIIVVPAMNPDGSAYSFYDYNSQRKNMTNYCAPTVSGSVPSSRNSWGVDINRNGRVGTVWDGYSGASATSCTSGNFAGPAPASEPEFKNLIYVDENFNIKFSMNVHSSGGYFMWPPGAYISSGRVTLPAPNIGVEKYFWAASDRVLNRVKEERGTAIQPGQTGAVVDVLYSAAGNTADDEYYNYGIIGWDFEVGADIFNPVTGRWESGMVGFQPDFTAEGNAEAMEFSSGNYGLLETALDYARDVTPPVANIVPDGGISQTPIQATFEYGNEPSVIYYTLDGAEPTLASTKWEAQGPRLPGQVFLFEEVESPVTLKWIGQDIRGNVSAVRAATLVVDSAPPELNAGVTRDPVRLIGVGGADPTATDNAGKTATATVDYDVIYGWSGFLAPIANPPAFNALTAGKAVGLKFILGSDPGVAFGADNQGMAIFAPGYPLSRQVNCATGEPTGAPDEVVPANMGLLTYKAATDVYQYAWKTQAGWARTCRELVIKLVDGTEHTALFKF
jgi:hypothetical protein